MNIEKDKIATLASQMTSREDLLDLLNHIKQADMAERGMEGKFYPFTAKHITYYCNPNNIFHRYTSFEIKKKSGGLRKITAPRNKSFKLILYYLNQILKSIYTPSDYAMGFTEGRSVVTNADKHKGQNYILNIDLKDFFPSIEQARVWKRLQLKPFNFPIEVANAIAGLCAMKEERTDDNEVATKHYILPQGAPTSPIITNMICDKLDRRLAGLAKRFGLKYTRYADDITFSSMHNIYQKDGTFRKELHRIITDQGFTINDTKTRLQKKGARQEVTGIVVSDKLNVTQKYVRDIRNILYMWDRYGYNVAYSKFFPKYKADKGHIKKGNPDLISVIDGKLMYLKMVKGEGDSVYLRLHNKFNHLANRSNNANSNGYVTYLDTTPLLEFEKMNNTTVNLERYSNYCSTLADGTPNPVEYDPATAIIYQKANAVIDHKRTKIAIHKAVNVETDTKEMMSISVCRNDKGETFKLIHRKDKVIHKQIESINLDKLNDDLDSLLTM